MTGGDISLRDPETVDEAAAMLDAPGYMVKRFRRRAVRIGLDRALVEFSYWWGQITRRRR